MSYDVIGRSREHTVCVHLTTDNEFRLVYVCRSRKKYERLLRSTI
jgi:hypothetical protein